MNKKYKRARSLACRCGEVVEQVLVAVGQERRPADRVLRALFRKRRELGARDRRLIRETVFSVFRWWGWLSFLAPASAQKAMGEQETNRAPQRDDVENRNHGEKDLEVWSAVLLTAQYLEWDTEPLTADVFARYAVHRSEKLMQALHFTGTTRERMAELQPFLFPQTTPASEWSYSDLVPDWCVSFIDCPRSMDELIGWLQTRPPLWVRVQCQQAEGVLQELRDAGFSVNQNRAFPRAAALSDTSVNVYQLPAYRRGEIEVQDLSSQLIGRICGVKPGQRWWDACAGGGGKTLLLADHMQGRGKVVASDIRTYKLKDLRQRARRGAFPNIETKSWDGKRVDSRKANFDGVLVDAPCSGSGTWRRNPDARWALNPAEVEELVEVQLNILRNASGAVRSGGVLVYATCSMFRCENQGVIETFLQEDDSFSLEAFSDPLTAEETEGQLQVWPWGANSDAMFVARMRCE